MTTEVPMPSDRAERIAMHPTAPAGPTAAVFLPQGAGREINAGGLPGILKVDPAWSDGAPLVHEQVIPPGRLVRAHWHAHVAQWSVVTAGALMFRVGNAEYLVEEGGSIWRPANLVHAVWNPGTAPARQVEANVPGADMLKFYEQYADLAADGTPDPEETAALAAVYGTHYVESLTAELERTHQVSAASGRP